MFKIDLTGQQFERWTVIKRVEKKQHRHSLWECQCICGTVKEVFGPSLRNGDSKSCGCLRKESLAKANTTHGSTKGGKVSSEYASWHGLKSRCLNPRNPRYSDYGGRGISVSDRWLGVEGFQKFLADVGNKPSPKHSLDRFPNNNGNYEPGNVRWALPTEQNNNRRLKRLENFSTEELKNEIIRRELNG